jgi:hypothetical protein
MNMIAPSPPPTTGYLDRLNEAQRSAVLHGDGAVAGRCWSSPGPEPARPTRWRTAWRI